MEADFVIRHRNESGVGDGNAVCIAREVGQDLRWTGEGSLGIDDPVGLGCGAQPNGKRRRGLQRGQLAGESSNSATFAQAVSILAQHQGHPLQVPPKRSSSRLLVASVAKSRGFGKNAFQKGYS